jgi:glycosyltransferase involved in cell wall biosynthesis
MRLLMTADTVGGIWTYALELAAALTPLGCETVLAILGPAPNAAQRVQAARVPGLRLIETGLQLDWLAAGPVEVREAARAIALLAVRPPAPVVAAVHSCVATWWRAAGEGPLPESFEWQTALVRSGLARADAVVCPSSAFAAAVADTYQLRTPPLVVYNGRSAVPAKAGALHDFAFTAGRLWDPGKNVATLDRAASRLGILVKAAGALTGPNGNHITLEHIHATGMLDEAALANCYSARPVFVSTALYEPFGLAVLEAALAGCPLVLSDIPTFRELWGGVALFVPPNDALGFADVIEELIGDTSVRLARGEAARQHAARFTPERAAEAWAAIYRSTAHRVAA